MASTLLGVAVLALSVPETAGQGTRTAVSVDVIQKHVGKKSRQQPERHLGRMVCSCEDGGFWSQRLQGAATRCRQDIRNRGNRDQQGLMAGTRDTYLGEFFVATAGFSMKWHEMTGRHIHVFLEAMTPVSSSVSRNISAVLRCLFGKLVHLRPLPYLRWLWLVTSTGDFNQMTACRQSIFLLLSWLLLTCSIHSWIGWR